MFSINLFRKTKVYNWCLKAGASEPPRGPFLHSGKRDREGAPQPLHCVTAATPRGEGVVVREPARATGAFIMQH